MNKDKAHESKIENKIYSKQLKIKDSKQDDCQIYKTLKEKEIMEARKYPSPNPMSCKEGNQNSRSMKRIFY